LNAAIRQVKHSVIFFFVRIFKLITQIIFELKKICHTNLILQVYKVSS